MKINGKIIRETKIVRNASYENRADKTAFNDRMEDCLINICRKLEIPVPLWLDKNTKEFVRFKRTNFDRDQFMETVNFDRLEIRVDI